MQCIINNEPETTAIQARLFTRHVSSVGESQTSTKYSDKKIKIKMNPQKHAHLTSLSCLKIIIQLLINTFSINKTNHGIELALPYLFTTITKVIRNNDAYLIFIVSRDNNC